VHWLILTSPSAMLSFVASASRRKNAYQTHCTTSIDDCGSATAVGGAWLLIAGTGGKWSEPSRQGLVAFQKVEGRPRTGKLTVAELQACVALCGLRPAKRDSLTLRSISNDKFFLWLIPTELSRRFCRSHPGTERCLSSKRYSSRRHAARRFRVYAKLPAGARVRSDYCIIQITYWAASRFTAIPRSL